MVYVTSKQFYMEDKLATKLDLIADRLTRPKPKKDALLLIEGGEGEGKTNLSFQVAFYMSEKTGRAFDNSHIFFKAEPLLKFAQETEEQIIIYDEPSLDMLSSEWWKQEQINIVKLLMVARKKRHFIIFNITKFYKFNEYIVVDRSIGLIHVYSRHEIEAGRFLYIKKKAIEWLFNSYKSSKRRDYGKYKSFGGTFPDFVEGIVDVDAYEKAKDEAILSIGKVKSPREMGQLLNLRARIGRIKPPIFSYEELARHLGVHSRRLREWRDLNLNNDEPEPQEYE